MAVYYKFTSAKDFESIPVSGSFISLGMLKDRIFQCKHLGRGTDFDLLVTNAQTNEEYHDEGMLIPKNSSVCVRRLPGVPHKPIVAGPVVNHDELIVESKVDNVLPVKSSSSGADPPLEDPRYDDFGDDLYNIPEMVPLPSRDLGQAAPLPSNDEDSKITALVNAPALDWQGHGPKLSGSRGGFRDNVGRIGHAGFVSRTPPEGYVCHRCNIPGHFIQLCPTNDDPNFDMKRRRPPSGIPKSMLTERPDGYYALPNGAMAFLKPDGNAVEKEIEGVPRPRSSLDLPPELYCPLCSNVMKDAVLTSKCCFRSFCASCMRDQIISKSVCECGAKNVLADDLLPNLAVRETIKGILQTGSCSSGNAFIVKDMESKIPQDKIHSSLPSPGSKDKSCLPQYGEATMVLGMEEQCEMQNVPQTVLENKRPADMLDVSDAVHDSKKTVDHLSDQLADEDIRRKQGPGKAGKKKMKKAQLPISAVDLQLTNPQDFAVENHLLPPCPYSYSPYFDGVQVGMGSYLGPYANGPTYMSYGPGLVDRPFRGVLPQDPFGVPQFMMPHYGPPQWDLAELATSFSSRPPLMTREEFESSKVEIRQKRKFGICGKRNREPLVDGDLGRKTSKNGEENAALKSKSKSSPSSSKLLDKSNRHRHEGAKSPECHRTRACTPSVNRSSSSKSGRHEDSRCHAHRHEDKEETHRHHHSSRSEASSKHKSSSDGHREDKASTDRVKDKKHYHHHEDSSRYNVAKVTSSVAARYDAYSTDEDDEDRHFKRRRSHYEGSEKMDRKYRPSTTVSELRC